MSDSAIKGLKPETLWQRFYEISQVPRPSKKEGKIVQHMKKLFGDLGVNFKEDKVGNLVASVKATPGYENTPIVVLQGHVDMVCEKNKTTSHDFDNDPIKLKREDGWIKADGTTLGSDNGIGVAAALAMITDKESVHGPLEVLLTIDEETGLTGANNLQPGFLTGKILLNLDSEEDGAFYVGCSGGLDTVANFKLEMEDVPMGLESYNLLVTGLKGGHSGLDISQNRANAIKILARAFKELGEIQFYISSIEGGSKRNAIPREAEANIFINKQDVPKVENILKDFEVKLINEFKVSDSGLKIEFTKSESSDNKVFSKSFQNKIINALIALPHGVISMSQDIPDLVETSTNVATISTLKDELTIGTSQRSSVESAKKYVAQNVASVFHLAEGKVESGDGYPGWKPNMDSNILKVSKNVYTELYGKEPEVKAIHAGLECGILGDKNPGMDMVSFGPTIEGAHSPDERVNIETVNKFYSLLKAILKKVADQSKN
jgi:dipeptidase D